MTFMKTTSDDDKSGICQFFYQDLFHIHDIIGVNRLPLKF